MSYKFTDKGSKYSSFWRSSFDTKSIFDDFDSSEDKPKKKGKDVIALAAHRRAIANFVRICTSENIPVRFTSQGRFTSLRGAFLDSTQVLVESVMRCFFDWYFGKLN